MKKNITILGATGSIGLNVLEVLSLQSERFELFALTAYEQIESLIALALKFRPKFVVVPTVEKKVYVEDYLLKHKLTTIVLFGEEALIDVSRDERVDIVVSAIVGGAGCVPTYWAAKEGKTILLANKESLVLAGSIIMEIAKQNGATILPVDSEHNAIFQVLKQEQHKNISEIILTGSGGPFLSRPLESFSSITVDEALKHPKWSMGKKISIDSATMMNKALEIIEAYWLFGVSAEQIKVLIHPESVIHSLVRFVDESVLAQLGVADMKIPIAYCLSYPDRNISGAFKLDLTTVNELTFKKADENRFPSLNLAYDVIRLGKDSGAVFNAANEVAVEAFLQGKILFTSIYFIVREVLDKMEFNEFSSIENLLEKHKATKAFSWQLIHSSFLI